ncbi:uncharacterized protein EV420DRAFT_1538197 [Desarmillaria tabescens]|uniref:F-box domain-containing protein n=1 Tax=Armillaria tabescens TaxID=1929756 RepID=A0AA39KG16_ARMTA|nr:uncharacterized protein EV420DRAFT_1538197 [Desarmillaria tabescens]KAK0459084.1 hypothetical protein EV420DRAFT_1538197 [Desarmillaria tabescens]
MTRVPVELYRCIVECVTDRKTLLSLLLTNHVLHDEAERILYRDVSNIFDIESDHTCWKLLPIALRALTNLKMLVFRSIGGSLEAYIPSDCACHVLPESKGSELSHFLPTQHRLRTIQNLQWRPDYQVPPPSSLPALSTLSGNYDAIKALLPGRTVTSLHWISDVKDVRHPDVSELVEPLGNLETFRLGGHHERPSLALLAEHLSKVKVLELFGVKPGDLECIDKLPHLEELKVSTQWGSSSNGPISPRDAASVVSKLFDSAPALQYVDIAQPVYWPIPAFCQAYDRWWRGSTKPETIQHLAF